jgi:hypothetical protein
VSFIAFEWVEEGFASLTSDDNGGIYEQFTISRDILANVLSCDDEDVEDILLGKLPIKCNITVNQNQIKEINILS